MDSGNAQWLKRSKLELRRSRKDIRVGFLSRRWVHPAALFTQMPNLATRRAGGRAGGASRGGG
eukprot:11455169-Alexandrium_andersonii.AAC.1